MAEGLRDCGVHTPAGDIMVECFVQLGNWQVLFNQTSPVHTHTIQIDRLVNDCALIRLK